MHFILTFNIFNNVAEDLMMPMEWDHSGLSQRTLHDYLIRILLSSVNRIYVRENTFDSSLVSLAQKNRHNQGTSRLSAGSMLLNAKHF